MGLSDTAVWADCGLQDSFVPTPQWTQFDFVFRASRDCAKGSRFQIWFQSTGTLWLDDVEFEEAGDQLYCPGEIVAAAPGRRNLVPNASFECGRDGWGSAEWDRTAHWGGPMNQLFGQLDSQQAYDGRTCLRIELNPDNQPVSFSDYYELHRSPVRAPLAGTMFAGEVLYRSPEFESEVIIPAGIASVVSYCVFGTFTGWEPLFTIPTLAFSGPLELGPYLLLALFTALLALLYTRSFYGVQRLFGRLGETGAVELCREDEAIDPAVEPHHEDAPPLRAGRAVRRTFDGETLAQVEDGHHVAVEGDDPRDGRPGVRQVVHVLVAHDLHDRGHGKAPAGAADAERHEPPAHPVPFHDPRARRSSD